MKERFAGLLREEMFEGLPLCSLSLKLLVFWSFLTTPRFFEGEIGDLSGIWEDPSPNTSQDGERSNKVCKEEGCRGENSARFVVENIFSKFKGGTGWKERLPEVFLGGMGVVRLSTFNS
ncbi:MAG: hypothetical protein F9K49_00975 [Caedimonadaceae bacterium]|nr:MAG: hypothetical protein F9K49_00975 [Caedimonadaceae bacterium]